MLADFRAREASCSMEKRWVETALKSEEREREVRFKEITRELLLQETPVKEQGLELCCQFWRMSGLGRDDLKLNKFWASLVFAAETGEETEREQRSRKRERRSVLRRFILWVIFW